MRQHYKNCEEFICKHDLSYLEQCNYKKLAETILQNVDDELFGCFNNSGQCVGYNYYN